MYSGSLRLGRRSQRLAARFVYNAGMSFRAPHGNPNAKRGRTPPPEETLEEASFLKALGEKQKPVSVKLMDGQTVQGWIEYYDKNMVRLTRVGAPNLFIFKHEIMLRDGRVLIVGGRGDKVNAAAEIFDPKTSRFTETGTLHTARYKHTAGLLPDGRVLIAGGSDERDWTGNLNSAEVYDPRAGRFSIVSPLNNSRFKLPEEAVPLESGELLVAGGSKNVEIFEPASGKFLLADGQISDAWHFMTETKLKDGSVLLAGGYANDDRATAQAWVYRP